MARSSFYPSFHPLGWIVFSIILITACGVDPDPINLIPEDKGPGIAVISPNSTRVFQRSGETGVITLRLADNEQLSLLRIVPEVYDQRDQLVNTETAIDLPVTGRTQDYEYAYTVPTLDAFFKVRYRCYVIDLAGQSAETSFWISVMPSPGDPPPFQTLQYESDTIVNSLSGSFFAYDLNARQSLPAPGQDANSIRLQLDIAENSGSGQAFWTPSLYSPNNEARGNDSSVFVITDEARFNYDQANYTTIFQAFFSDPAPSTTAPPTEHPIASKNKAGLEEGDIVIVRLIKTPMPQFAVMRIKEVVDDGPGINIEDLLIFDYKITSP